MIVVYVDMVSKMEESAEDVSEKKEMYHKSLNTGRGSDLIVLIEAGPHIQARFQRLAQLVSVLSKHLCTVC